MFSLSSCTAILLRLTVGIVLHKKWLNAILRKEFESELKPHFKNWGKGLWGDQLYIRSAGGAPVKILEEYIQSHSRG